MRTNKACKKSGLTKVAVIIAIVLCFIAAFGLTLKLAPVGGVALGANMSGGGDKDGVEYTLNDGASGMVTGDTGVLTAKSYKFPGTGTADASSWSITEKFTKLALTTSDHQMYRPSSNKTVIFSNSDTAGRIYLGVENAAATNTYIMSFTYDIGDFARKLLAGGYTIEAQWSASSVLVSDSKVAGSSIKHVYYFGALATSAQKTAKQIYNVRTSSSFTTRTESFNATDKSLGENTSNTVTLTKTNNILMFVIGDDHDNRWTSRECSMKLSGITLTLTIKYPTSDITSLDDGGAPVKLSDIYGETNTTHTATVFSTSKAYEYYNPYRPTVSSSWPVYYASIAADLQAAIDAKDTASESAAGNWTLNSYTSAKLTKAIGKSQISTDYYKMASIDFADTYDYSYSGGFSLTSYQSNTSSYRTVAGVAGQTISGTGTSATWAANASNILSDKVAAGIKKVEYSVEDYDGHSGTSSSRTLSSTTYFGAPINSTSLSPSAHDHECARITLSIDSNTVGYLVIAKITRSRVRVSLYMTGNAKVTLKIYDYGDKTCEYNVGFKGIDTTAPEGGTALEAAGGNGGSYIANTTEDLITVNTKWFKQTLFSATVESGREELGFAVGGTPYLWFYTVQRADTAEELGDPIEFDSYLYVSGKQCIGANKSKMLPLGYGVLTKFEYDFENGGAKGYKSDTYNVGNPTISGLDSKPCGEGYYRFNFYLVDAAGNLGATSSQHVKVDYAGSDYGISAEYIYGGANMEISQKQLLVKNMNDATWALGETKVAINIDKVNFSGNTITFTDANDNTYYITVDRYGRLTLFSETKFLGEVTVAPGEEPSADDRLTLNIGTLIDFTDVYFSYAVHVDEQSGDHMGVITVEFQSSETGQYPTVAWQTSFEISSVAYASNADIEGDTPNMGPKKEGKACIFIDRLDPDMPTLSDEESYLAAINRSEDGKLLYAIDSENKKWKTDGYKLDTERSFFDTVASNERFGSQILLYIAVAHVATLEDFEALANPDMLEAYKTVRTAEDAKELGLFLSSQAAGSESAAALAVDLYSALSEGLRVIYIWAVDQAGRISALNSYYVLVDTTSYRINSSILDAIVTKDVTGDVNKDFGHNYGTISSDVSANVKRGETVTLTVTLNNGYVPFRFNSGDVNLLYNYTADRNTFIKTGSAVDDYFSVVQLGEDEYGNPIIAQRNDDGKWVYTIKYTIDDGADFKKLSEGAFSFTMSARKVVSKKPDANKGYDATVLDMSKCVTLSDMAALPFFEFEYYSAFSNSSKTGTAIEAPLNQGIYYIRIYLDEIDKIILDEEGNPVESDKSIHDYYYNEAFVLEHTENDYDDFIVAVQFAILKGDIYVTPVATASVYGDVINLSYNISGFSFDDNRAPTGEHLDGSLKLDTASWGSLLLGVGPYYIVQGDVFAVLDAYQQVSENYNVIFTSGVQHNVTPRTIQISAVNESKQFGNPDPTFRFAVDPAQFDWYAATGNSVERLLKDTVFSAYTFSDKDGEVFRFFADGNRIKRVEGENVGAYAYLPTSAIAISDQNYKVVLSVEGKSFSVDKREVVISSNGYFTVILHRDLQASNLPDITAITPGYTVVSGGGTKVDESIKAALVGQLKLVGEGEWGENYEGYYGGYAYDVALGDLNNVIETEQLIITLQSGAVYYIYVGQKNAVIFKVKDGVSIEYVYGQIQKGDITYANLKEYFDVTTEAEVMPSFTNVTWNIGLTQTGYLTAGSYGIAVSDAKLFDGSTELANQVVVETFTVKVNPAEIVIIPTSRSDKDSKEYGQEDDFRFDFAIQTINGKAFAVSSTYAGLNYSEIKALISGSYARGRYSANDKLRALGEKYDPATDSNGLIIGGNGDYYSYTVGTAFTSSNSGFAVTPGLNTAKKFKITQKAIELDVKYFVGVNKAFDNTTAVNFGSTVAYNLSSKLARATDSLRLAFNAEYTAVGSMNQPTSAGIIFTLLRLEGNDANNYSLSIINNTSNLDGDEILNELWNGANKTTSAVISNSVRVVIYYLNNTDKTDRITISMGAIAVRKTDFSVSKVYDGTRDIAAKDIDIAYRTDENGGSAMLYQLWGTDTARLISSGKFTKADVCSDFVDVVLFFDIPGIKPGSIDIKDDGAYYDETINIYIVADEGIRVEITGLPATITQKVLGVDDFVEINPVTQDYSSKTVVKNTEITLAYGALVDKDVNVVSVEIVTEINDGNADVGTHTVEISDESSVGSGNYRIDVEALNNAYSGDSAKKVTINKAKLLPNVQFRDREYDGSAVLEPVIADVDYTNLTFITENYRADLLDELAYLSNFGDIEYLLSDNGSENANVMTDGDGNVVPHSVIVRGVNFRIESQGKINLANYEMLGSRYNAQTKQYESVDATLGDIADYEFIGAVVISRKTLKILSNNLVIKDKVYDMTDTADVKITLDVNSGIALKDEQYALDGNISVTATGKFAKSNVDTNIPVTISNVVLTAKEGYEKLLNNYELPAFSERRTASILPRPIGFTVDLGEKTYNGDAKINNNNVSFRFETKEGLAMLGNDAGNYVVDIDAGSTFFIDKNVAIENGQIVGKEGTVFNPKLMSRLARNTVNYVLTIATPQKNGENYIAYVDVYGNLRYGESVTEENEGSVICYYYPLPTVDRYITIAYDGDGVLTNEEAINKAFAAGAVAGRYVIEGIGEVYAIDSTYEGDYTAYLENAMTYVKGYGTINQKAVSVSTTAIQVKDDTVFEKMYDGTKTFFGVEGIHYEYANGGVIGIEDGDRVTVTGVVAEFDTEFTTASYVVFTPSGIGATYEYPDSPDYLNYRIDGKIGSAMIKGKITKRPIDAFLKDGTMVYGTKVNTIVGDIQYKVHGNPSKEENATDEEKEGLYLLIEWDKQLYLSVPKFKAMMGAEDLKDELVNKVYVINMDGEILNGFDKLEGGEIDKAQIAKYYIQLSSITTLPAAKATFGMSLPPAGEKSIDYKLTLVTVDNYAFNPLYTNETKGSSVLTVVKRDLFIATSGDLVSAKLYNKNYIGDDPTVEIYYLDGDGNRGFAPSENDKTVFGANAPEVRWGVLNTVSGEWTMLEIDGSYAKGLKYAQISDDLDVNEVYAARLFVPASANGYKEIASNYNVILPSGFAVDGDNLYATYSYNDGEGNEQLYGFRSFASTLTIQLPDIGSITLHASDNDVFNYTYDGKNHVRDIVVGHKDTDEIKLDNGDGNSIETINADDYTGHVIVRREIKIDDNDPNGYYAEWRSNEQITIRIAKASPKLEAVSTSRYFDGSSYAYEVGKDGMIKSVCDLTADMVDISYEMLNGDEYAAISDGMRNAGVYRITVALNDKFEGENSNYLKETVVATYTVLRALVDVTISAEGYGEKVGTSVKTLVAEYDAVKTDYAIGYTIVNMSGLDEKVQLPKTQTDIVFEREISSPGRYAFSIKITEGALDAGNYKLVGEQGVLELNTKSVETGNAAVSVGNAVVANRLVAKEISEGRGNGADIDLWSSVNEYMAYIDSNAKLDAVVRLELYCDDTLVTYKAGGIDVSVEIPDVVGDLQGKAVYMVTSDGGLQRLSDYTVTDGRIEYKTNYLGALVFVDLTPNTLPLWLIILIAVGAGLVAITVVWVAVALVVRKSKLKKLA